MKCFRRRARDAVRFLRGVWREAGLPRGRRVVRCMARLALWQKFINEIVEGHRDAAMARGGRLDPSAPGLTLPAAKLLMPWRKM